MTPGQWEQVGRIYQSALEVKTADRAEFLDQACGDNQSLRREVESLLAADGKVVEVWENIHRTRMRPWLQQYK